MLLNDEHAGLMFPQLITFDDVTMPAFRPLRNVPASVAGVATVERQA